jgi:hypothetical protein
MDRILGDPCHAERMGQRGKQNSDCLLLRWDEVAQRYLELCAAHFPELRAR